MTETFTHDVFLSHCAKDTAAASGIAERLRRDGLRVWFDEWKFRPRERAATKHKKREYGLEQSRTSVGACRVISRLPTGRRSNAISHAFVVRQWTTPFHSPSGWTMPRPHQRDSRGFLGARLENAMSRVGLAPSICLSHERTSAANRNRGGNNQ
jgi:hypothetical protein